MFRNKNLKRLVLILTSGFVLVNMTGCKSTDYEKEAYSVIQEKEMNENIQKIKEEFNRQIEEQKEIEEQLKMEQSVVEDKVESREVSIQNNAILENDVIDYCYQLESEIDTYLESEDALNAKEKVTQTFITFVDFLFYDGEIKGVTFDELSYESKEKVKEITSNTLAKITTKYPDFSSKVENKYQELKPKASFHFYQIKDFLGEKYETSLKKIEGFIGEENYNNFKEGKDEMKESFKNTYDGAKAYVKEKYESFRNKHSN